MSYETVFLGIFNIAPNLQPEHQLYLEYLSESRQKEYNNFMGENSYNEKLSGLPDSDCCWIPNQEGTQLIWNGNRAFYDYKEWIYCLLDDFLIPWGYKLSGNIDWYGEEPGDVGRILIADNVIKVIDWLDLLKEYNYTSEVQIKYHRWT